MIRRCGFLGALLLGGVMIPSTPEVVLGGGGPRPSERVEHLDGTGVSIFTILPDQSEWTIENFWQSNSVNGTVGFPDDTTTFINCAPTNRTIENTSLECRIFDAATSTWGDPIATTVDREYLHGDFLNTYNSLFGVTGEYLVFAEAPGLSQTYRVRFLAAREASPGFPILIGSTNPPTDAAFLLRDVDAPGGAMGTTNFTLGMQTGTHCLDFHVTPSTPGGALVGTVDVRTQNGDGSCGDLLVDDRPTALPPGGGGSIGSGCEYEVLSGCATVVKGRNICVPCYDTCPVFETPPTFVIESLAGYAVCDTVVVQAVEGAACSANCDGVRGLLVP